MQYALPQRPLKDFFHMLVSKKILVLNELNVQRLCFFFTGLILEPKRRNMDDKIFEQMLLLKTNAAYLNSD